MTTASPTLRTFYVFCGLTYGWSWSVWALGMAVYAGWLPLPAAARSGLAVLAASGPSLAALYLTYLLRGASGLRALLEIFRPKGSPVLWFLALALPIILHLLARWTAAPPTGGAMGLPLPSEADIGLWTPLILPQLLIGGPLQEELGWRGYALPLLLQRLTFVRANLVLGLVWGCWHLPLFLTLYADRSFPAFLLQAIPFSFVLGGILLRSHSLWPVMFCHFSWNLSSLLLPLNGTGRVVLALLLTIWAFASLRKARKTTLLHTSQP